MLCGENWTCWSFHLLSNSHFQFSLRESQVFTEKTERKQDHLPTSSTYGNTISTDNNKTTHISTSFVAVSPCLPELVSSLRLQSHRMSFIYNRSDYIYNKSLTTYRPIDLADGSVSSSQLWAAALTFIFLCPDADHLLIPGVNGAQTTLVLTKMTEEGEMDRWVDG